jgi:hypothetical protein
MYLCLIPLKYEDQFLHVSRTLQSSLTRREKKTKTTTSIHIPWRRLKLQNSSFAMIRQHGTSQRDKHTRVHTVRTIQGSGAGPTKTGLWDAHNLNRRSGASCVQGRHGLPQICYGSGRRWAHSFQELTIRVVSDGQFLRLYKALGRERGKNREVPG